MCNKVSICQLYLLFFLPTFFALTVARRSWCIQLCRQHSWKRMQTTWLRHRQLIRYWVASWSVWATASTAVSVSVSASDSVSAAAPASAIALEQRSNHFWISATAIHSHVVESRLRVAAAMHSPLNGLQNDNSTARVATTHSAEFIQLFYIAVEISTKDWWNCRSDPSLRSFFIIFFTNYAAVVCAFCAHFVATELYMTA